MKIRVPLFSYSSEKTTDYVNNRPYPEGTAKYLLKNAGFSVALSCRNRVEYRISDFVMTDVRVTFDDLVRVQIMKLALLLP